MEKGNLATGKAHEPQEEACQPLTQNMPQSQNEDKKRNVAFAEIEQPDSQISSAYKEHLSQPPRGLSQLQKLLWLQKKRTKGLWVQCDECDRWRYLPDILDRYELPKKWFCWMNPDKSLASCSEPEIPIHLHDEEDLIHNEYSAGSLVLASLPGWPWWPAMVDDCPDTEQFYWLDGLSDIPTHYNVVFFDLYEVTRAWIDPTHLKAYSKHKNMLNTSLKSKKCRKRLEMAIAQAEDADALSLMDRLKKYSFICRYKGPILKPKKINKKYQQKYQKQFKRKYNIELPDDSETESSDSESEIINNKNICHKNVFTPGSKKSKADKEIEKDSSLDVQVDTESVLSQGSLVNGTLKTDIPNSKDQINTIQDTQEIENRTQSPASDDFDF